MSLLPTTGNPSKHLFYFRTEGDGITRADGNDKLVRLQWNALDNRIEANNVDVEGGNLEIHGHIYNTDDGRLKVLDGYAQVSIDNPTNYDLMLTSLTNNGLEGRIKITDTSRTGSGGPYNFHVTEIERIGNTIRTTVNGSLSSIISGRTTTYAS